MKTLTIALVVLALAATIALAQNATQPGPAAAGPTRVTGEATKTPSGLQYWDIKVGTGPEAQKGQRVKVHYTGWLTSGKKFDSSVGGKPFDLRLGAGDVIKGWDEGIAGMKARRATPAPFLRMRR